jgi:hypothetical protein
LVASTNSKRTLFLKQFLKAFCIHSVLKNATPCALTTRADAVSWGAAVRGFAVFQAFAFGFYFAEIVANFQKPVSNPASFTYRKRTKEELIIARDNEIKIRHMRRLKLCVPVT